MGRFDVAYNDKEPEWKCNYWLSSKICVGRYNSKDGISKVFYHKIVGTCKSIIQS